MRRIVTMAGIGALVLAAIASGAGTSSPAAAYPTTQRIELQIAGRAGIPFGASAVVMNVTATNAVAPGYVVVWPCGQAKPEASNLNYEAGQDIPNLVVARIGVGGQVCLEASADVDLIADVAGHFPFEAGYTPTATPVRILDTRETTPVTPDEPLRVQVAGRAGVPAGAAAVLMNVTATGAADSGYVTVFPCTSALPDASNLNFVAGQDIPNLVIARPDAAGEVCLHASTPVNLIADVAGHVVTASELAPVAVPVRILDTRSGLGAAARTTAAGETVELQVAGRAGIPGDAAAVAMNVTVSAGPDPGFVTVYPCGKSVPEASNLNHAAGQAIPNLVVARLGEGGRVCLHTSASVDLIADVAGHLPAGSSYRPTSSPVRLLDTRTIPAPEPAPTVPSPPAPIPPAPAPPGPSPTVPPPTVAPPSNPPTQQPPNPGDSKNCGDFATYADAKAWYDLYFPWYGDVAKLDADKDGIPCESLPGAP